MTDIKKDEGVEDLYDVLKKTLDASKEEDSELSPEQKPQEKNDDGTLKEKNIVDESGDLTEEEISKLSPRAQKRIKDLATKVKELAEKPETAEEVVVDPKITQDPKAPKNFDNVKEFLDAVEDEPSRKLLETFYGLIKKDVDTKFSPIETKNNETRFETEFSQFEKIEGLSDYKDDLKKTFLKNPNVTLKSLIGEIVTDLSLSKIKPIDTTVSDPKRGGTVDLEALSKDELYTQLDSMKGQ